MNRAPTSSVSKFKGMIQLNNSMWLANDIECFQITSYTAAKLTPTLTLIILIAIRESLLDNEMFKNHTKS